MRLALSVLVSATVAATPPAAAQIVIPLPAGIEVRTIVETYDCGGRDVGVTYINAGDIALAVLEIGGETVVAANVISASGARYAGGRFVWWSKGNRADLYDLTAGGEDAPGESCVAKG